MAKQKYRSGTPGRLDINGVEWHACDPYPTWYRWENGELYTSSSLPPTGAHFAKPEWPTKEG